jgi:hypothetical protein
MSKGPVIATNDSECVNPGLISATSSMSRHTSDESDDDDTPKEKLLHRRVASSKSSHTVFRGVEGTSGAAFKSFPQHGRGHLMNDDRNELLMKILDLELQLIEALTDSKSPPQDRELHTVLVAMEGERHRILDKLKQSQVDLTTKSMEIVELSDTNEKLHRRVEEQKLELQEELHAAVQKLVLKSAELESKSSECFGWQSKDKMNRIEITRLSKQIRLIERNSSTAAIMADANEVENSNIKGRTSEMYSNKRGAASGLGFETTEPPTTATADYSDTPSPTPTPTPSLLHEMTLFSCNDGMTELKEELECAIFDLNSTRENLKRLFENNYDSYKSATNDKRRLSDDLGKSFLREELLKTQLLDCNLALMTCTANLDTRTSEVTSMHDIIDCLRVRTASLIDKVEELEERNNRDSDLSPVRYSPLLSPLLTPGGSRKKREEHKISSERSLRQSIGTVITLNLEPGFLPLRNTDIGDIPCIDTSFEKNINGFESYDELFNRTDEYLEAQNEINLFANFLKSSEVDLNQDFRFSDEEDEEDEEDDEGEGEGECSEQSDSFAVNTSMDTHTIFELETSILKLSEESDELKKENEELRLQSSSFMKENSDMQDELNGLKKLKEENELEMKKENDANVDLLNERINALEREIKDSLHLKIGSGNDKSKTIAVIKSLQAQRDEQLLEIKLLKNEIKEKNKKLNTQKVYKSDVTGLINTIVPFTEIDYNELSDDFDINNIGKNVSEEEILGIIKSRSEVFEFINSLEKTTIITKIASEEFRNKIENLKNQNVMLKALLKKNENNEKAIHKMKVSINAAVIKKGLMGLSDVKKENEASIKRLESSIDITLKKIKNGKEGVVNKEESMALGSQKNSLKILVSTRIKVTTQYDELVRLFNTCLIQIIPEDEYKPYKEPFDFSIIQHSKVYTSELQELKKIQAKCLFDISEYNQILKEGVENMKNEGEKYTKALFKNKRGRDKVVNVLSRFNRELHTRTAELNYFKRNIMNSLMDLEMEIIQEKKSPLKTVISASVISMTDGCTENKDNDDLKDNEKYGFVKVENSPNSNTKTMVENDGNNTKYGEIDKEIIRNFECYSIETHDLIDYFRLNKNSFVELNGSWDSTTMAMRINK